LIIDPDSIMNLLCYFLPLFNGLVPPEFTETESEILGIPATKDSLHAVLDEDKEKINFTRAAVHEFMKTLTDTASRPYQ